MTQPGRIVLHYLRTWAVLDAVSITPWWAMPINKDAGLLRLVRLARLFKLLRVFQSPRIVSRLSKHLNVSSRTQTIMMYSFLLLMSIHGSACCLRLITDIQLQHCNTGSREREAACPGTTITKANTWHDGIWAEYTTAIVWSFTAMNGEATFVTHAEGVLGFAMMLVGCILLAFLLGDLANIASNLDPVSNDFKQTLDSINDYMTKLRYPKELRVRLREYVMLSEPVFRFNYYQALLDRLSPGLQAVVAQQNHGAVISNIPFFLYSVHKFYGLAAGSTVRARAPRRKGQPVAWSDRRAVVVRITPDLKYDLEYVDLDPPEMESVSRRLTSSRLVRGIRRRDGGASLRAEESCRLSRPRLAPRRSPRAAPRPPRRGARRNGRHRGGGAPERAEERFA